MPLKEIDLRCIHCHKSVKTTTAYANKINGIIYCAYCRAEHGFIDGINNQKPAQQIVWVVEGGEGMYEDSHEWLEGVFATRGAAVTYLVGLGAEFVSTEFGDYYVLPENREGHRWTEQKFTIRSEGVQY